jgi:hypothetical protein
MKKLFAVLLTMLVALMCVGCDDDEPNVNHYNDDYGFSTWEDVTETWEDIIVEDIIVEEIIVEEIITE